MRKFCLAISFFITIVAGNNLLLAQPVGKDTFPETRKIVPGPEYKASGFKRFFWGDNYRDVWTMPSTVKLLWLSGEQVTNSTISAGINNDLLNIHIKSSAGKEFLVRPVDKSLGKKLPELFRKTFIEYRLRDGSSASNPFAGAPVSTLSGAAKIYSSNTTYRYLPSQASLGSLNNAYGNGFYVFEELVPGNFENYITTATLLDTLNTDNNISIDAPAFIRARLFDMFLNDWNKPESNWLWGKQSSGNKTVYIPLPVNRDQAFSNYDGLFFGAGIGVGGLRYFQKFKNDIPDLHYINQQEKNIDRRLLNGLDLNAWQTAAKELQQSLTDEVIENAIKQFPPEVFAKIGNQTIATLKERRKHIPEWANKYYAFISKDVEVPGSANNDIFSVQNISKDETLIQVFNSNNSTPYYSRTFNAAQTKEVRLFGLSGNDIYKISGVTNSNNIKIKISDGLNSDSVIDNSDNKKNNSVIVYSKDGIATNSNKSIRTIADTTYKSYDYNWFRYNRHGLSPLLFYSMEDRLHVGLTYSVLTNKWGKKPFASLQTLSAHYSIMENAPSITYRGLFPKLVLGSNLLILANYDHVRWQFYYGLGNDTKKDEDKKQKYYTTRTRQWVFRPQLAKYFGNNSISVFGDVQGIQVIDDTARFIAKPGANTTDYKYQTFVGGGFEGYLRLLNNVIIPTKGIYLDASAAARQNVNDPSNHYMKFAANANFYIPLSSKFSFRIGAGGSTVTGNPQFYQYATIGGILFRGVPTDRFRGKTAFYNTNDLRFIAPFHSYFFNGKAGIVAFFDNGRVWLPGETSNTWHTAFGGGLIAAPFNFVYLEGTIGFSGKENSIQVRAIFPLVK